MKHASTKSVAPKTRSRKSRWSDSGLSARYGKLGSGAICAALLYAGTSSGGRTRKTTR